MSGTLSFVVGLLVRPVDAHPPVLRLTVATQRPTGKAQVSPVGFYMRE